MDGGAEGRTSRRIWIAGINYSSGSERWRCWRGGGAGVGCSFQSEEKQK